MVYSTSTRLSSTITNLTASLARTRTLADAESRIGAIAALGLIAAVEAALDDLTTLRMDTLRDDLAASLPAIAGGCDDEWSLHPGPASTWPAWTDRDSWTTTEPTPLGVLEADAPIDDDSAFEAWLEHMATEPHAGRWSDADQLAAFGHV